MQRKTVGWAILGAGRIAHKFAQDFKSTQHGEIVAVAARDDARAAEFAHRYGIAAACTYDALYKRNDVDIVYIATPHNFHFEQSMACIENGKAVLCEKPVTLNHREFKKLAEAATAKGVFFMEAMWTYFLPAVRQAKAWLDAGRIGTLKMVQADFGVVMPFDPEGRLFNASLAGGALLDLGVYNTAMALFFTQQKPDTISASGVIGRTGVDESNAIVLKHGSVLSSLNSAITTRLRNKALLFGDAGHIELPEFWKARTATLYNGEHEVIETFTDDRSTWGYNFEIQDATDALLSGALQSGVVPHTVSHQVQEILTEARRQMGLVYPMEA